MTTKQLIALTIVAIFGFAVIVIYVPNVATIKTVSVYDIQPKEEKTIDACPVCGESFIYGDGFTMLVIQEYDIGGRRIAPYRQVPAMACNNCGTVRIDLQYVNNQPTPALESLIERPEILK